VDLVMMLWSGRAIAGRTYEAYLFGNRRPPFG
jgi:hypothetical protein